ncbi:MAG: hypothetical protein K0U98_25165 [Deltaproteobacteria bacterium]|nr:hypothetical protein [Deltaproteobacteria bacterium]
MNRGSRTRSWIAAAGLLLAFSTTLEAQIIQTIPWNQSMIFLPNDVLLSGGPLDSGTPQWSLPSYGYLTEAQGGFFYHPYTEFWQNGFDSFRITSSSPRSMTTGSDIYLIADLKRALVQGSPIVGCSLGAGWHLGGGLNDAPIFQPNSDNPNPVCILDFPMGGNAAAYVNPDHAQTGPGGGNTTVSLDPGGNGRPKLLDLVVPLGEQLGFAAGVAADGSRLFEMLLEEGPVLRASALRGDGTAMESIAVPVTEFSQTAELNWWFATAPGANDGGALLILDGRVVASIQGVDNYDHLGQDWEWQFGALDTPPGAVGSIGFQDFEVWESPSTPIYEPLYSNSATSLDLTGWKSVQNPDRILAMSSWGSTDPEFILLMNGDGQDVSLQDGSATGAKHYRSSFVLGLDDLQPPGSAIWKLFVADTPIIQQPTQAVFRLLLRYDSVQDKYFLRAKAGQSGTKRISPWIALPNSPRMKISLQWWSPTFGAEHSVGGLRVSIPGTPGIQLLNLTNAGFNLGDTTLGALKIPVGMQGSMVIDDFIVWH